jgi:signal transduction histidine kinase
MKDASYGSQDFESYLYIITHDLKTYSRAMRVIPEWIEEDLESEGCELPEEVKGHIAMLGDYARGMDRMLDGLTDLSRVGRLADTPTAQHLQHALSQAWSRVANRDQFTADFTAVEGEVLAPANDLGRLLHALLSNAVVHHDRPHGQVVAATELHGDHVVLRISDDGPGIEEDMQEKVFQPLFTLRPKDEIKTAGMGLAVAKKVLDTLFGTISLSSPIKQGRGTMVECVIPRPR